MKITRRGILKSSLAVGAGAFASTLTRFGRLNALTPPNGDYRALVCVFLFGGNDSNNLIVPLDAAGYNAYNSIRRNLALAQTDLLPVDAGPAGAFGLHPKLAELQGLFKSGNLAVLANVGTLVRPLTRDLYQNTPSLAPSNLFSHSDQQAEWQTALAQGQGTTGWGGRLADRIASRNNGSSFPTLVSVTGNAVYGVGEHSRPASVIPGAPLGLQGYNTSAASKARLDAFQEILSFDSGARLVQQASIATRQGIDNAALLSKAFEGAPELKIDFPANNSLASQLQQIAKIIQVRSQLGMSRQIFFCSLGGFDTHTNQLNDQDTLFTQVSQALGAFYRATQELGVAGSVTTFTESDFSRTFQPNTNGGTDHAWGSHQLILGGSVKGGALYGEFPALELNGPNDAGKEGRWIPSTGMDEYGATLSNWFGLDPSLRAAVFPNIGNFQSTDLGFLAV